MSFSGSGAGRFQIRRIRNGSTAESLIVPNGPLFQDFAQPTGQHSPNWDNRQEAADIDDWAASTNYAVGKEVEYEDGIFKALVAITGVADVAASSSTTQTFTGLTNVESVTLTDADADVAVQTNGTITVTAVTDDGTATNDYFVVDNVVHFEDVVSGTIVVTYTVSAYNTLAPKPGQTTTQWEYEGPVGTPLILDVELLVNGTTVDTSTTFARAASPVNAQVTGIAWAFLSADTGLYVAIDGTSDGFSLGADNTSLIIDRNLDNAVNFPAGALSGNMLQIRCEVSYNITGVLDANNTLQTLKSTSFATIRRNILTESSMFSRIFLTENGGVAGASSQIWNSGFTGDKQFQADLIIGANVANDDPTFDVAYQWYDSDGALSGATGRTLTRTRAQVDTAETFYCVVTDVHTGIDYTTNSIELRDFLDPVQFVEIGTATVDTGSNGRLQVIPFQNGAPMKGLTSTNTIFDFTFDVQANATDTTGTAGTWLTTTAAGGLVATGGTVATNRFLTAAGAARTGGSYETSNTVARIGVEAASTASNEGVTIQITDTEMGAFGVFLEYDVTFTSVAN